MDARARCALCGCDFDPAAQGCRGSCPLANACAIVCCPRCHYAVPQEGRGLAGLLRRAMRAGRNR